MLYGFRAALIAGAGRTAPEQTTMTTSPAPLTAAQALLHESDAIAGAILADVQGGEPALDLAGLVAAQRRLLATLEAQLGELERAGRQLTVPAPKRRKQTLEA